MGFPATPRRVDWTIATYIVALHAALAVGLPLYFAFRAPASGVIVATVLALFWTEIGIGAAYHRHYSHRGFTLARPAEGVLLLLATLAFQGSALRWSHDHRKHHAHVDTDEDPYSIRRGFFYAHMGWLFWKGLPLDERWVRDLLRNPLVTFQHRWYVPLGLVTNAALFALVGWASGDWLGAFVLAWWTRLLLSYHLTWFINSLAHTWGSRCFSREHSAVDNFVVALLTVGEGYHNYHHTFPSDYRNGVRWYHFDPTKWTVWSLSKLGLASNLRRVGRAAIERRLVEEDRRQMLAAASLQAPRLRVDLEARIHRSADALQAKLLRVQELAEAVRRSASAATRRALRRQLSAGRREARVEMRQWSRLCGQVLSLEPCTA